MEIEPPGERACCATRLRPDSFVSSSLGGGLSLLSLLLCSIPLLFLSSKGGKVLCVDHTCVRKMLRDAGLVSLTQNCKEKLIRGGPHGRLSSRKDVGHQQVSLQHL